MVRCKEFLLPYIASLGEIKVTPLQQCIMKMECRDCDLVTIYSKYYLFKQVSKVNEVRLHGKISNVQYFIAFENPFPSKSSPPVGNTLEKYPRSHTPC